MSIAVWVLEVSLVPETMLPQPFLSKEELIQGQ